MFQLWAFNTLSKHPYREWFLLTCSYWEKSNNVDFSDFTVKYFLEEMSSSGESSSKISPNCSLQTYQVSGRNLKKWKKNLDVINLYYRKSLHWLPFILLFFWDFQNWKKSRTHTTFLFHFPVAKALKKNIFDTSLIFMWYLGGGSQRAGANFFSWTFPTFTLNIF